MSSPAPSLGTPPQSRALEWAGRASSKEAEPLDNQLSQGSPQLRCLNPSQSHVDVTANSRRQALSDLGSRRGIWAVHRPARAGRALMTSAG